MFHWRKSSKSDSGTECVELGAWRKSSYSGAGNDCVELAPPGGIRDSKNPDGPALVLSFAGLVNFARGDGCRGGDC